MAQIEGSDEGRGFGVLGMTTNRDDSSPEVPGLRSGVLGIDGTDVQIFIDPTILHTINVSMAGVTGLSTRPERETVGVFGAKATGTGPTPSRKPVFGFLGGVDPNFHQDAGVFGTSGQVGVHGHSDVLNATGVFGNAPDGSGVRGETVHGTAIQGQVFGDGIAIAGKGGRLAGHFEGDVEVTGAVAAANVTATGNVQAFDIVLVGADCAEEFNVVDNGTVEPGTVMVIDETGALRVSGQAYDTKVAGVVSGAGEYKPGVTLDRRPSQRNRVPVALFGKVYCKVDAQYAPLEVGDLLTTSPTPGHAMKASDPARAFGSVIGKALQRHAQGCGMIPILIALQ